MPFDGEIGFFDEHGDLEELYDCDGGIGLDSYGSTSFLRMKRYDAKKKTWMAGPAATAADIEEFRKQEQDRKR